MNVSKSNIKVLKQAAEENMSNKLYEQQSPAGPSAFASPGGASKGTLQQHVILTVCMYVCTSLLSESVCLCICVYVCRARTDHPAQRPPPLQHLRDGDRRPQQQPPGDQVVQLLQRQPEETQHLHLAPADRRGIALTHAAPACADRTLNTYNTYIHPNMVILILEMCLCLSVCLSVCAEGQHPWRRER